jgi:hypothetical protein
VHHLFLTNYAVYLAVFNMADLVGDEATEETREKSLAELHGWLNDLWMHAAGAPVIPVGTHKDAIGSEVEQLEKVESLLRDRFEGTKFWPYLASNEKEGRIFFAVNSRTRTEDGRSADPTVGILRQKVEELAKGEKYIDTQLPFKWLRVIDRLQMLSQGEKEDEGASSEQRGKVKRLPLDQVYEIANECGLPSDASVTSLEDEVSELLDMFHQLGMLVHFNVENLR